MKRYNGAAFYHLSEGLAQLDLLLADRYDAPLSEGAREHLKDALGNAGNHIEGAGLTTSQISLHRLLGALTLGESNNRLRELSRELQGRIHDELLAVHLLQVPDEKLKLYENHRLFGEEVHSNFPSAAFDIEEAGKCHALDRHTATVFHLMRVMESGLRALGKSLNNPKLDPRNNPAWTAILDKCDRELQKPFTERSPEWREGDQFFSQATANLRAVKDAWRNPTLHIEKKYTDEEDNYLRDCRSFNYSFFCQFV